MVLICVLSVLYLAHYAQEVAAPQLFDVSFSEAFCCQAAGKIDNFRSICAANDATVSVKVGANAYVVNACDIYHMYDVAYCIVDSSSALLAQESIVEAGLHHTTRCCKCAQLVVSKIARMVTESSCRRVATYDGRTAFLNGLGEAALGCM